jgi:hypothetical protein
MLKARNNTVKRQAQGQCGTASGQMKSRHGLKELPRPPGRNCARAQSLSFCNKPLNQGGGGGNGKLRGAQVGANNFNKMQRSLKTFLITSLLSAQVLPLPVVMRTASAQQRLETVEVTAPGCPFGTTRGSIDGVAVCFERGEIYEIQDIGGREYGGGGGGGGNEFKSPQEVQAALDAVKKKDCEAAKKRDIELSDREHNIDLQKCVSDRASGFGISILGFGVTFPAWLFDPYDENYENCKATADNARKKRERDAGKGHPACS